MKPVKTNRHGGFQRGEIFAIEPQVGIESQRPGRETFAQPEDFPLDAVFFRIGQLETAVVENLDPIIAIRVVRRGNHDARGEGSAARQVSHRGRGSHTGKTHARSTGGKPPGY